MQKALWNPRRINVWKSTSPHIVGKVLKTKKKEKYHKTTLEGAAKIWTSDFLAETIGPKEG